jgi:mannose-6-phosphate isomerase-like protein (cupin superfamily)
MEADTRSATYVPAGEGRNLWIQGQLLTFKIQGLGAKAAMFELVIPPQDGTPPHLHPAQEEIHYILEGQYEFHCADRTIQAGPGAVVHVPAGMVHCFTNIGIEPGQILFIATPAGPLERFLEEVGEPITDPSAAQGPPLDIGKLQGVGQRTGGIAFVAREATGS